jgi:UDP-3-O-[3-hydroxymyristoyl] glucosamine N-acyltransferase
MNRIFFKKSKKFIFIKDILNICNYLDKKFYNQKIFGVNNIEDAKIGDVTFFNDLKYENNIKITKA